MDKQINHLFNFLYKQSYRLKAEGEERLILDQWPSLLPTFKPRGLPIYIKRK